MRWLRLGINQAALEDGSPFGARENSEVTGSGRLQAWPLGFLGHLGELTRILIKSSLPPCSNLGLGGE